jgi:hypothetical protein
MRNSGSPLKQVARRNLHASAQNSQVTAATIHFEPWSDHMEPSTENNRIRCPQCGGSDVERIRRRFIDRLISLISLQRRFRCRSIDCEWEGNLSARRFPFSNEPPQ